MQSVKPIQTVELFPPLSAELIGLLRRLSRADWEKPTACAAWNVKQVALHLLGGNVGRLSRRRDELDIPENLHAGYAFLWRVKDGLERPGKPINDYAELVQWIDRTNAEWVQATDALETNALIELLELSDAQVYEHFKRLDPDAPARISVLWAGETQSPNWFDIAREYTEKWLHQQHIRDAVNAPLLDTREFLHPVLDTFLRALPHTYRAVPAPDGTTISFRITGQAGGDWSLVRQNDAWILYSGSAPDVLTRVFMDQNLAWRVFTKGVSAEEARAQILIDGDEMMGREILKMVSIMA
ncbi:MAG: maleylpyruvate isomerase family mycothiol-dependent enzyme [Chloroflexi bacterium]|nr:maleylpyruvate isomerase family mycothiol-dependent enzyme [Chloroflexota bacterium]